MKINLGINRLYRLFFLIAYLVGAIQTTDGQVTDFSKNYGLPVLPGISGFGLDTRGGQGGVIIKVTNLNRDGKGSLAEAISFDGPRMIVFEIAGVIDLGRKSLRIVNPYITIAGQTAPYPGITLIKGGITVKGHDVIIQHLKIRPGEAGQAKKSGWEVDGISTDGACDVIIDHCSITWSTDENLSASGQRFEGLKPADWRHNTSHRIVFSNCIIAEGLSNSTHSKGEHSKGTLIHDNTSDILIFGNLYANNKQRNPFLKGGAKGMVVNNYIYNPGNAALHFSLVPAEWEGHEWLKGEMVVESNVIEYGQNSSETMTAGTFKGPVDLYWKNNKLIANNDRKELSGSHTLVETPSIWPQEMNCMPAEKVINYVLENAGAFPWQRDDIDRRIVEDIKAGKGKIIDSENEVGGYPVIKPVYRKFDPDEWEFIEPVKKTGR